MRTVATLNSPPPSSSQALRVPHSPWHSPVPYLFGGLAAMLGLIAFALLILACSYWKLSGNFDSEENQEDLENGDEKSGDDVMKAPPVFEEKIVVIMAGDVKPTYLATPMSSRASSFGSNSINKESEDSQEKSEKPKQDIDGDEQQQSQQEEEQTENRSITQSSQETQLQDHQV
ncbi:hypothetical protein IFM89_021542 [Coptis chinensis]|uniref:Uncharacterized protein n=1 Tax=Coptis chinensis TaxID=261450 RepID=A0A835IEA8_9MAGN|nr:hypothetical protein IFM89_021542 [Coptis chinensis]